MFTKKQKKASRKLSIARNFRGNQHLKSDLSLEMRALMNSPQASQVMQERPMNRAAGS